MKDIFGFKSLNDKKYFIEIPDDNILLSLAYGEKMERLTTRLEGLKNDISNIYGHHLMFWNQQYLFNVNPVMLCKGLFSTSKVKPMKSPNSTWDEYLSSDEDLEDLALLATAEASS